MHCMNCPSGAEHLPFCLSFRCFFCLQYPFYLPLGIPRPGDRMTFIHLHQSRQSLSQRAECHVQSQVNPILETLCSLEDSFGSAESLDDNSLVGCSPISSWMDLAIQLFALCSVHSLEHTPSFTDSICSFI